MFLFVSWHSFCTLVWFSLTSALGQRFVLMCSCRRLTDAAARHGCILVRNILYVFGSRCDCKRSPHIVLEQTAHRWRRNLGGHRFFEPASMQPFHRHTRRPIDFTKHTADQHSATRVSILHAPDGSAISHFPAWSTARRDVRGSPVPMDLPRSC